VDQALCFGWIDGLRRAVDEQSYTIRFTPRRPTSIWSEINTRRVKELIESGDMRPAGLAVFEARRDKKSAGYSLAKLSVDLDPKYARVMRKNTKAWRFYKAQPPGYRKLVNWWVVRAKQEATRLSRLQTLISHSEKGERVPRFTPQRKKP
jgi:uncharacterized protein YdeI (YjbR/CyaY-like superfamily)